MFNLFCYAAFVFYALKCVSSQSSPQYICPYLKQDDECGGIGQVDKACGPGLVCKLPMPAALKGSKKICDRASWKEQRDSLAVRWKRLCANPVLMAAFNSAIAGLQEVVQVSENPLSETKNPWLWNTCTDFGDFFYTWVDFLPSKANGLEFIEKQNYFVRGNPAGAFFLNRLETKTGVETEYCPEVLDWTTGWLYARKDFMDSKDSTKLISDWVDYLNTETTSPLSDYEVPEQVCTDASCGFSNFNEFFSRALRNDNKGKNPPRPISDPDNDFIVVAPADSEINFISTSLTLEQELPVKSLFIDVKNLLGESPLAAAFVGGTAVSCVLMPNNYHRFHAPVSGEIIESKLVKGFYFGILDGENWFNFGNTGGGSFDFNTFSDFTRAYYIYNTTDHGLVAQIPVGLAEINSLMPMKTKDGRSTWIGEVAAAEPLPIKKGDPVGYFQYGGSLNILLFQSGVFSSVEVLTGQRLGTLGAPTFVLKSEKE